MHELRSLALERRREKMQTRTAFFLAMLIAAGQPFAAEPAALITVRPAKTSVRTTVPAGRILWALNGRSDFFPAFSRLCLSV
jgi:hypothetical protein